MGALEPSASLLDCGKLVGGQFCFQLLDDLGRNSPAGSFRPTTLGSGKQCVESALLHDLDPCEEMPARYVANIRDLRRGHFSVRNEFDCQQPSFAPAVGLPIILFVDDFGHVWPA
jgi:hypothetical protein